MDGILNLNKPRGWTSHDTVACVRRMTGIRRVGHAGTLDPLATGVLLICLGQATRIAEYLMAGRKRYRTVLRLGVSTDSHDADGRVTAKAQVDVTRAEAEKALSDFQGSIEQIPPMVSAIKRNGQPLYRLARRGIAVERAPRPIEIFELNLTEWSPPSLTLDLVCSPGTYVRALARDLGEQLGCGAHVTALTRLASGGFTLCDAIKVEHFAVVAGSDPEMEHPHPTSCPAVGGNNPGWHQLVLPMDAGLTHLPSCSLNAIHSRRVRSGQTLAADLVCAPQEMLCRVYSDDDPESRLLALLRFDSDARLWRPHKVFHPL